MEDDFSESSLRRGISATEEKCNSIPEKAIWSPVSSNLAECIKYWSYGLTTNTGKAIVYLHQDFSFTDSAYLKLTGEMVSRYAVEWSRRVKAPYIFIGRPGVYGSSGDQSRRRLLEESQIISATLDGLKKKYGINEFVKYSGMTKVEVDEILDSFTNPILFRQDENGKFIKDKDYNLIRNFEVE